MTRREKADRIGELLDELYPAPPIPLDHQDPFTLLVSVLLSAQTTDKKVNEVTPALFSEAPDPESMAALPVDRILALIRTVGLAPTKAKNLKAMARLLVERHGGQVPVLRPSRVPGRHAHPPSSCALGTLGWEERRQD